MNQNARNTRFDPNRLNIGAYYLNPYARTEQHIRDVADCGVDFILNFDYDRAALDLFAKYGIGAVVWKQVPYWLGGSENDGKMAEVNPLGQYEEDAKAFVDHPAVWAIDIGDEPSALDFAHYGKVFDLVSRLFPNQMPFLNLYPNYAKVSSNSDSTAKGQLGEPSYEAYIQRYCELVPSDYISYDFYLYEHKVSKHYENLRIVADAARNTGRSMWIVLQVNSTSTEIWMSENNLRFQAYSAMAFGAQTIMWACYTAGWWVNQVLDDEGNKTQQYEKLKKINREIHTIGEAYMRYRRVSTHFVGLVGHEDMDGVQQQATDRLNTGVFFDVHADNGAPLVVGQMVAKNGDGSHALMICAADDPHDKTPQTYSIVFRTEGRAVTAIGGNGRLPVTVRADGTFAVEVCSNAGVLLIAR